MAARSIFLRALVCAVILMILAWTVWLIPSLNMMRTATLEQIMMQYQMTSTGASLSSSIYNNNNNNNSSESNKDCQDGHNASTTTNHPPNNPLHKPKIAIISGFVTKSRGPKAPRIAPQNFDHMINKACYADIWGYDFIVNTTWGWPDGHVNEYRYWLNYGTWHRVPHMAAALPQYDWIVYADVDWYVQDLTIPFESFLKDWELHGKHAVSVFVPVDEPRTHVFSAYVVMIRNNEFGRRLLQNWLTFADGLCPKGNFPTTPGKYDWVDSDQPGLWYALPQTHSDIYHPGEYRVTCRNDTGTIQTGRFMGPEMRQYFSKHGLKWGNQGKDLYDIPDDQPILWSIVDNATKAGLGVQKTYGRYVHSELPHAFALHKKQAFEGQRLKDLETCKRVRGCHMEYDEQGVLHIGCSGKESHKPPPPAATVAPQS